MLQREFDREIERLRNHFGERHYSAELVGMLWKEFGTIPLGHFRSVVMEAIATRSQNKAPLRDDFRTIAQDLGIHAAQISKWKYIEVDDCLRCGGCGWHYVLRPQGGEAVVACDDCRAGKNLQIAPKGIISHTLAKCPAGTSYSRPGSHGGGELVREEFITKGDPNG